MQYSLEIQKMKITKDINIGPYKWIKWIDFNQNEVTYEIDAELMDTEPFWKYLETECVRECCGIDAYSFLPQDIEKAKKKINNPNIKNEFIDLREKMNLVDEQVICSSYLNNLLDISVFITLLDHIIDNL